MVFRVAVLGPLGTYTHEAAHNLFGPDIAYDQQDTVQGVFDALPSPVTVGVVPQENSIFGTVVETYDCLREAGFVRGEVILEVQHCLLVRPGVKLEEVQKVLSHEQALGQCREFIKRHLPLASLVKTTSTAAAARALLDNPPNCAAICSRVCASLFGLSIIREGIQNDAVNFTRFYIIARNKEIAMPNIRKESQTRRALLRIVTNICSKNSTISQFLEALQIDFIRIDRRPSGRNSPFVDVYFVELQGKAADDRMPGDQWLAKIMRAVERVQEAGGDTQLIGLW